MGGGIRGDRISYAANRPNYESAVRADRGSSLMDYVPEENTEEAPKIFISFQHEDIPQARLLGYQLECEQNGIEAEDNSPKQPYTQPYPGYWKVPMSAKIGDSDVFILVVGEDTHKSAAVKWEVRTAKKSGKPIYAVRLYADERHKIPQEVYDAGGKVLPWNLDRIKYEITTNA